MRLTIIAITLGLLTTPLTAQRLDPSDIQHLGSFTVPSAYSFGNRGLTHIPDCLGRPDPTPNDGYPGCIGAFENASASLHQFGVYDIVPPGSQAQHVVPPYDLSGGLPLQLLGVIGSTQHFDVLYDKGWNYCRLWWTYGTWYVRVDEDMPFLGYSSCDPANPNPQGMWDFGAEWVGNIQDDPFHTAKMYQGLSEIPQAIADQYFDGKRMAPNTGRYDGTRGGSQGPSIYVRPMEVPTTEPELDIQAALWYRYTGQYMSWQAQPELLGGAVRWWPMAFNLGFEFIDSPSGRAVLTPWQTPTINPQDYPCSDPNNPYSGNPNFPQPCEVPVCWYGVKSCRQGPALQHQPSFWEWDVLGSPMPKDCKIVANEESTGPHCLSIEYSLILYDLDEIGEVYRGSAEYNDPQPYAELPMKGTNFVTSRLDGGTTYDQARQLLYVGVGGTNPRTHVFSISGGGTPPPPPAPPINLSVSGNCPGSVTVTISDAPPNSEVAVIAGSNTNGFTKGSLTCNGTVFEIGEPFQLPPMFLNVDGTGSGSANMTLKNNHCWLQAVAFETCAVSNADQVP